MRSRLLLGVAAAGVLAACAPGFGEDTDASDSDITESAQGTRTYDPNKLLDDEDLVGGTRVTKEHVQSFLESKSSFLATYTEDGKSAAEIIVERSREQSVNPIYMLARIQGESSLVESRSARQSSIPKATGCGCPDGQACAEQYRGFGNQIKCAAELIRKYYTQLERDGRTVSGWAVGQQKQTLDPCTVTPKNKATTALYTYTPWVGAYGAGCGTSRWGGSSAMAMLTLKYRDAFPASARGGGAATSRPDINCDETAGAIDPACVTSAPPASQPSEPFGPPAPADLPTGCTAQSALELCDAAFQRAGVECGSIPDGCGGTVSCDGIAPFGCAFGDVCSANRCTSTTAACVPLPRFQACTKAAVECGSVPDGCGGTISCDVIEGFGCAAGSTCLANGRCDKPATTKPPVTTPPPSPPTTTPKPTDPPSAAAPEPPRETTLPTETGDPDKSDKGDDDDDDDDANDKDKDKDKAKSKTTPKKAAASEGCSAAPGTSSGVGAPAVAMMLLGALLRRRRRSGGAGRA